MDHIDHVAARVSAAALLGGIGGVGLAAIRGFPLPSTAIKVGSSCAIVSTSLFGTERLGYAALEAFDTSTTSHFERTLISHAFSGFAGGALNGYVYQKRPIRGMIICVPVMMVFGWAELEFQKQRERRRQEIMAERSQRS